MDRNVLYVCLRHTTSLAKCAKLKDYISLNQQIRKRKKKSKARKTPTKYINAQLENALNSTISSAFTKNSLRTSLRILEEK